MRQLRCRPKRKKASKSSGQKNSIRNPLSERKSWKTPIIKTMPNRRLSESPMANTSCLLSREDTGDRLQSVRFGGPRKYVGRHVVDHRQCDARILIQEACIDDGKIKKNLIKSHGQNRLLIPSTECCRSKMYRGTDCSADTKKVGLYTSTTETIHRGVKQPP